MVTTWTEEVLAGVICMHRFFLRTEENCVASREHRAYGYDLVNAFEFFSLDDCLREHGINWKFSHAAAELGQVSIVVKSA